MNMYIHVGWTVARTAFYIILFVPWIVGNKVTTFSQQNAQSSGLDIDISLYYVNPLNAELNLICY